MGNIEMLHNHTDTSIAPLLIMVTGSECMRAEGTSDDDFKKYCGEVENEVMLNFVFVEHSVL